MNNSLKGWEIKNIGANPPGSNFTGPQLTPLEYSNNYHQPRENQNILNGYIPNEAISMDD